MIFSRINILNKYMIKFISFFSPLTFSVQLIHSRIFTSVPKIFIFFRWVRQFSPNTIFFKIYGLSIIINFICTLVDYMRLLVGFACIQLYLLVQNNIDSLKSSNINLGVNFYDCSYPEKSNYFKDEENPGPNQLTLKLLSTSFSVWDSI